MVRLPRIRVFSPEQYRHRLPDGSVLVRDAYRLDFWYNQRRNKVRLRRPLVPFRWEPRISKGTEYSPATDRAERALQRYLTDEQWLEFVRNGQFTAIGQTTRTPYRVQIGRVIKPDTYYCIWARYTHDVPTADTLLSLALMIQLDERRFLETAIPTRGDFIHIMR